MVSKGSVKLKHVRSLENIKDIKIGKSRIDKMTGKRSSSSSIISIKDKSKSKSKSKSKPKPNSDPPNDWNPTNVCMSYAVSALNKNKGSVRRCTKQTKNDSDFCGYHKKSQVYYKPLLKKILVQDLKWLKENNEDVKQCRASIKKELSSLSIKASIDRLINKTAKKINDHTEALDKDYIDQLMMLEPSWANVPIHRRINLSDGWWDLEFILNHFSQQLNHSDMENPYPIYPRNPLTRECYLESDIQKIRLMVVLMGIPVNVAFRAFIMLEDWVIYTVYNEANNNINGSSSFLLNYLNSKLKFKYINFKNSQDCYTGHWVSINTPLTKFEKLFKKYNSVPWQAYDAVRGEYIINPERIRLQQQMNACPKEHWSVHSDNTKASITMY